MTAASAGVQPRTHSICIGQVALRLRRITRGSLLAGGFQQVAKFVFVLTSDFSLSLLALSVCDFRNRVSTLRHCVEVHWRGRQSALRTTRSPSVSSSTVSCHSAVRCASSCCSRSRGSHVGVSGSGLRGFPFPLAFPLGVRCGCVHGYFLVTEKVTQRVVRPPVGWSFHGTGSDRDHSSLVRQK